MAEAEGIADRDDRLADTDLARIAEFYDRQLSVHFDLDQREMTTCGRPRAAVP